MTVSSPKGGWRPKVCTSIYAPEPSILRKRLLEAVEQGSDYIEIRLDYLRRFDVDRLGAACRDHLHRCIFTCRHPAEGGRYPGGEEGRLRLLTEVSSLGPAYVDLELRSVRKHRLLPTRLADRSQPVIISSHNLRGTPKLDTLEKLLAEAQEHSGTVKIVSAARTLKDNFTLLSLYSRAKCALIAFCTGELGVFSRVLSPLYGSPFTYASLRGLRTAPGQVPLDLLRELYRCMELR